MKTRKLKPLASWLSASALAVGALAVAQPASAGIMNTKHNLGSFGLTGSSRLPQAVEALNSANGSGMGDVFTTGTDEICVFCHTPHGANITSVNMPPLWNKQAPANTVYTVYNSGTMQGTAASDLAGHMSLACLSCHDGTQAMDNVVNAPGSGQGVNNSKASAALGLGARIGGDWFADNQTTATSEGGDTNSGALASGAGVFFLGTDLSNDHPIGMSYGGGSCNSVATGTRTRGTSCKDTDFYAPQAGLNSWFEIGPSGAAAGAKSNMRIYGTTVASATVECGSCHDPHSDANKTFLRKDNAGSAVCLTCHIK